MNVCVGVGLSLARSRSLSISSLSPSLPPSSLSLSRSLPPSSLSRSLSHWRGGFHTPLLTHLLTVTHLRLWVILQQMTLMQPASVERRATQDSLDLDENLFAHNDDAANHTRADTAKGSMQEGAREKCRCTSADLAHQTQQRSKHVAQE